MKEIEAKQKLAHLLDLVETGEEIIKARRGKPVARLISVARAISRATATRHAPPDEPSKRSQGTTLGGFKDL